MRKGSRTRMTTLEKLREAIELGHPNETEEQVRKALEEDVDPVILVEDVMVPAMRRVGEKYKNQETDIPGILSAARSVQKGFQIVKERKADYSKEVCGTIILGTIEGDLHDVGKNLVAMMFRGAGFRVIDLGVDVSEKQFLRAVKENPEVSIVCISSLLSTTFPEMRQVVRALRKNDPKHKYKIMIGGGAVTKELAEEMGADGYTDNCVDAAEMAKKFVL